MLVAIRCNLVYMAVLLGLSAMIISVQQEFVLNDLFSILDDGKDNETNVYLCQCQKESISLL